eukprot:3727514-Pyramimonas_sp.AAC.1
MAALSGARELALRDRMGPLALDQLEAGLRSTAPGGAEGIVGVGLRGARWLPESGRRRRLGVFREDEAK